MGTAESIRIHAASRREAIAFSFGDREITYATLDFDLQCALRAVMAFGVSPGDLVAIDVSDPYSHCLLTIALEQLGAGAGSFSIRESDFAAPLLSRVDVVIAASACGITGVRRLHTLTTDWLENFRDSRSAADPAPRSDGDDPVRITRTSGTTGVTKTLIVPRRQNDARLQHYAKTYEFDVHSRYFVTMALSVFPIYGAVMACLRSGGTVVFASQQSTSIASQLADRGITHVALTPLVLKELLGELPENASKPEQLTIYAFGAGVSAALRARALDRLATRIFGSYGCNEAGFISIMRPEDEEGSSTIWPGVEVQIVDDNNAPLPSGAIGRIRVRSEFMVEGYLNDPDATRHMFKDGWFYPGDSGVLDVPGRLKILGRTDDLLNIGGVKYVPEYLERWIAEIPGILDVGVCSLRNREGIDELCVAAVATEIGNDDLQAGIMRTLHKLQLGTITIVRIAALPRNGVGKIQRDRLRNSVRVALAGGS